MKAQRMPGHFIRRLHQVSTQVFNKQVQEAGFDLTSVQFAALDAIAANPGVDQASIAALIAYDRATIGGVISRLEQKGLLSRVVSQSDHRARKVSLTELGETTLSALLPVVQDLQDNILGGLDEKERQTFLHLAIKALVPAAD
jgi:DNA-binding MarR family transcriptional regulator